MGEHPTTPAKVYEIPDSILPTPSDGGYERRIVDTLSQHPDEVAIQRLYLGRAGELFVAAHLLRMGLNSAALPVDTGVDLLAHRESQLNFVPQHSMHELYQFQVKTTTTGEYRIALPVRKIHDLWHKAINLVVVFWKEQAAPSAVIFPPSLIRMLTSGGFEDPKAPLLTDRDQVSLRVFESGGRYFIRNLDNEITAMLNRFDRIEPVGVDTTHFPEYACWSTDRGLVKLDSE